MTQYPQMLQPRLQALEVKPVKIEEILRLLVFVIITLYAVCHMLFIPIEFMVISFCLDPDLKGVLYFICILFGVKYIIMVLMFYTLYHHENLWKAHSHWELYLFAVLTLGVTGFYTYLIYTADEQFRKFGFGSVFDHPFYYDFIGLGCCGLLGSIYILYMACTKPVAIEYFMVPSFDPYHNMQPMQMQYQTEMMPFQPQIEEAPKVERIIRPVEQKPLMPAMSMPIYYIPQ